MLRFEFPYAGSQSYEDNGQPKAGEPLKRRLLTNGTALDHGEFRCLSELAHESPCWVYRTLALASVLPDRATE